MSLQRVDVSRREFMKYSSLASSAMLLPTLLANPVKNAMAAPNSGSPIPGFADDRVLVIVQLSGGNDGLNTIIPYENDIYYNARPNLAIPKGQVLKVTDTLGFSPAMKAMQPLFENGTVSVINGVGYPNPDHSHFRSMEIWHHACDADRYESSGWLGNYFNTHGTEKKSVLCGVDISASMSEAFASTQYGVSFQDPNLFRWMEGKGGDRLPMFRAMNKVDESAASVSGESSLQFLRHTTANLALGSEKVSEVGRKRGKTKYPNGPFSRDLKLVSDMIQGHLPTRVFYVSFNGFDTHANQANPHQNLLRQFAEGMAAFQKDLKQSGHAGRVLTMAYSEFGRRVAQNGSKGTDHGVAGPMFLMGNAVKGGMQGSYPDLANQTQGGDLIHTVDFRSVYATVLDSWFKADSKKILRKKFKIMDLLG